MQRPLRKELEEKIKGSRARHERAKRALVSFYTTGPMAVPTHIVYFQEGKGAHVRDVDGNDYVDLSMGIGPLILGHCHEAVTAAALEAVRRGPVHGMGHEHESRLAELIVDSVPGLECVTFTNSGTEATLHALKVARAFTGKERIAKFAGAYHGVHEQAQICGRAAAALPPEAPRSKASFAGIPRAFEDLVLTLSYGYPQTFDRIRAHAHELAAVIVEPVPTACPIDFSDYLRELRRVTRECGVVLIFDEVLSGFRMGLSGAQGRYGITPDLTTYGKIIGGGFPVGAIAGSRRFMAPLISAESFSYDRKTVITTTFGGNPVTCAAGAATIGYLRDHPEIYPRLEGHAARIRSELTAFGREIGFPLQFLGSSCWLVPVFGTREVRTTQDFDFHKAAVDFELLRHHMCRHGVLLADAPILFTSAAHGDEDIGRAIAAFKASLREMQ